MTHEYQHGISAICTTAGVEPPEASAVCKAVALLLIRKPVEAYAFLSAAIERAYDEAFEPLAREGQRGQEAGERLQRKFHEEHEGLWQLQDTTASEGGVPWFSQGDIEHVDLLADWIAGVRQQHPERDLVLVHSRDERFVWGVR